MFNQYSSSKFFSNVFFYRLSNLNSIISIISINNLRFSGSKLGVLINEHLVYYATPSNFNYWFGFGALAGLFLCIQLITGIFLVIFYKAGVTVAFDSVLYIIFEVPNGWLLRSAHANGASLFFIIIYLHIGRGLYFGSYLIPRVWPWLSGVVIFLLIIATAFLGYVLPWGQISFWGATVITNFVSAIPIVGVTIVEWVWGGFSVGDATLNRFFRLHYLLPFVIAVIVIIHLFFLHDIGSNNPLGISSKYDDAKIPFAPFFVIKDAAGFFSILLLFFGLVFFEVDLLGHPDNYIQANPIVTPTHIVPEWYFLPFYAILRAVPSKLGGVIAIIGAIIILALISILSFYKYLYSEGNIRRPLTLLPFCNFLFWSFTANFLLLGWLGGKPAEEPYVLVAQISSFYYFFWFFLFPFFYWVENSWIISFNKKLI